MVKARMTREQFESAKSAIQEALPQDVEVSFVQSTGAEPMNYRQFEIVIKEAIEKANQEGCKLSFEGAVVVSHAERTWSEKFLQDHENCSINRELVGIDDLALSMAEIIAKKVSGGDKELQAKYVDGLFDIFGDMLVQITPDHLDKLKSEIATKDISLEGLAEEAMAGKKTFVQRTQEAMSSPEIGK